MAAAKYFLVAVVLLCLVGLVAGCGSDTTVAPNSQEAPLLAPQNVMSTRMQGGFVLIAWDPNTQSNLLGYNIYRGVYGTGTFTKVNPSLLTDTQYIDTSPQANTRYEYRVRCVSITGTESGFTSVFIFTGVFAENQGKWKKPIIK